MHPAIRILGVGFGAERNFLAILMDLSRMLLAELSGPTTGANSNSCVDLLWSFRLDCRPQKGLVAPTMVDHLGIGEFDVVDALTRNPFGILALDGRLDCPVFVPSGLLSYIPCDRQKFASSISLPTGACLCDRLD